MNRPKPLPRMLFISPRFLFPADTGGQIRTSQTLRHANNRWFDITLLSPPGDEQKYGTELSEVCNRFVPYRPLLGSGRLRELLRVLFLPLPWPVPVVSDFSLHLKRLIRTEVKRIQPDVVVYDFLHQAINLTTTKPDPMRVLFTHNVEQEIFKRQMSLDGLSALKKWVWKNQYQKMVAFEKRSVCRFDRVLAVSERDKEIFQNWHADLDVVSMPTGVDPEQFSYAPPDKGMTLVFTGSLDAHQNIEGIGWFLDEIWPLICQEIPDVRFKVIGRNPPQSLVSRHSHDDRVHFTGWVDDVVVEARSGAVYVVPLRVGGGTRIKIYEAMALGIPVVSTTIGAEGLELNPSEHFLQCDDPVAFSQGVCRLLRDRAQSLVLSQAARTLVEQRFGWGRVAKVFSEACQ
ncbi:MAG: glycosyltransferase [Magnetococcales bacterium]|nr:glycosyltransferase [Magnetococcales bacterium]